MSLRIARAFAPATVANVGVGFDILGFALEGIGEFATVEKIAERKVIVMPVDGYPDLPLDPSRNTCSAGLLRLMNEKKLNHGFKISLQKNIPVGSGLGGSSTSAVATIVAANALLKKKLSFSEMLDYALTGEEVASRSRHADNIAPCLAGGLVFVRSHPEIIFKKIKTPATLRCVILLPDISIKTSEARGLLKADVPLKSMVEQTANLAGFILGCMQNDFDLIQNSLKDAVIEPQRKKLIPAFDDIQSAALLNKALGCSISGSGPAIFALAKNQKDALKIQDAMKLAAKNAGVKVKGSWVSGISKKGAHLRGKK